MKTLLTILLLASASFGQIPDYWKRTNGLISPKTPGDRVELGTADFFGVRTVGGCPMFPSSSYWNTRIDGMERDYVGSMWYAGKAYPITAASYSGGTCTATVASTQGLAVGVPIFVTRVTPGTYNTGYNATYNSLGYGQNRPDSSHGNVAADVRVTITSLDSTHISWACASDPGSYVSGGYISIGPYGGTKMHPNPSFALNLVTNSTTALYPLYMQGYSRLFTTGVDGGFTTDSLNPAIPIAGGGDNVPMRISSSSYIEDYDGSGTPVTIGAFSAWGTDAHVITLNTDSCHLSELYALQGPVNSVGYVANQVTDWDLRSNDNRLARLGYTTDSTGFGSAVAAGTPLWPGVLTHAQVYGSEQNTGPLLCTFPVTQNTWQQPATHEASHNSTNIYPPMGAVFRLKSDFDTTTCQRDACAGEAWPDGSGGTPNIKGLLTRLQRYGCINYDNGGAFYLQMEQSFTNSENDTMAHWLAGIYGESFDVANVPAHMPDGRSQRVAPFTTVTQQPLVQVALATSPANLQVVIDGRTYQTPQVIGLESGTSHTVSAPNQDAGTGSRYTFSSWSDGGASSHTIAPTQALTLTATYSTQYQLTTVTSGLGTGTISPTTGNWYDPGTVVAVTATATGGSTFWGFQGDLSGTTNPQNVTMSAARTVTAVFYAPASWAPTLTSWSKRKPVDLPAASGGSALSSFPVLIYRATDSELSSTAKSDGSDIRFALSDGTVLVSELEKYTSGTGELWAWVKVPTLAATGDTVLYMYYGNAAASAPSSSGLWDSSHVLVSHLKETAASTSVSDATGTNTLTAARNASLLTTTGKIANGFALNGSSDVVSASSFPSSDTMTISAWIKRASNTNNEIVVSYNNSSGSRRELWKHSTHFVASVWGATSSSTLTPASAGTIDDNSWHLIAATSNGTTVTLYVDGAVVSNGSASSLSGQSAGFFRIGATHLSAGSDTAFYGGSVDEVRVSNSVRSAGWIATSYNNQNSPGTWLTVYSEEHQ